MQAVVAGLNPEAASVETQLKLLTSHDFLRDVVEQTYTPHQLEAAMADKTSLAEAVAAWIPKDLLIASGFADEQPLIAPEVSAEMAREAKVDQIADNLSASQSGRSYMIAVRYTSGSPSEAARVANAVADRYLEEQLDRKLAGTRKATDWLETRLSELEGELRHAEQAVERYRADHKLLDSKGVDVSSSQMINLTNMLVQARAERSEKEARLRYVRSLQGKGQSLRTLSEVLESPLILTLMNQDADMQRREAELRTDYGDKHPIIQNIRADRAELKQRIDSEIRNIVNNTENEIEVLRQREASFDAEMSKLVGRSDEDSRAEIELRRLEREAQASRQIYESFLSRYKETREQQGIIEADARVVQQADVPDRPSNPSPVLFLAAGFVGSSMLGLLLAFLRERLDDAVRSGKEVERELGVPCVGLVPYLKKRQLRGHKHLHDYLFQMPLSTYAETVRSVFTSLRLANVDNPPQVIQITSSVPGEGKTTFAVSLATSLVQQGHKTVLIDLDMRHPSVKRELDIAKAGKLIPYMMGEVDIEGAIQHDPGLGLDVIGVDATPPNPPRLLGSQRMRDLMTELRARYDYVVIDSTPVLGVSDSKAAMELADTVLFVVRWEHTTLDTAADAVKELRAVGADVSGVVITQVDVDQHARYGYGGIDGYYSKYKKYYTN